jgi:hypothetical protein
MELPEQPQRKPVHLNIERPLQQDNGCLVIFEMIPFDNPSILECFDGCWAIEGAGSGYEQITKLGKITVTGDYIGVPFRGVFWAKPGLECRSESPSGL